ncbi:MAG: AzlC family ABC transporter permease [Caldilineaceae bacterium]|nr:AzlC family ABC transporter permease [Caldilineaceae bacterium]
MAIEIETSAHPLEPAAPRPTRGQAWLAGAIAVAPLLVGALPFGLIYGVLAVQAGLPLTLAQAMSSLVFAGSAQFITTQLLQAQAPLLVIFLTAVIVNLRHVLYSASLAPYLQPLAWPWQAGLAYLLTDEAYAVVIARYRQPGSGVKRYDHWYFLGTGLTLWIGWQLSTAVGVFLGAQIPAAWSLDFAMPLTFIAIVIPALTDRATAITALVAGIVVLITLTMPLKLGLVTAITVAIGVGFLVEDRDSLPRT